MISERSIAKVLESLDARNTKITLLTRYSDHFSRYLIQRRIILDPLYRTDMWKGVESAYTIFELPVPYEVADLIFDDWLDDLIENAEIR